MREGIRNRHAMFWAYGALSLLFLFVAWNAEIQHDYRAYVNQWTAVLDGLDPWRGTDNAYGPLFNAFAPLFDLHPKLPHAVFLTAYVGVVGLLAFRMSEGAGPWLALLLVNPLFLIFGVLYGSNDLLLGAIVLLMLSAWQRSPGTSGALLAVGAGYKLLPLALGPVMAIRPPTRRLSRLYLAAAAVGVAAIFGTALVVWGDGVWEPFFIGADRKSKMFSIFRYLRGDYSVLSPLGIDSVDGAATVVFVVAVAGASLWALRQAPGTASAVLLVYTVLLTTYPVGHHQFYLPYMLVAGFALIDEPKRLIGRHFRMPLASLLAWVSLFALLYHLTDGYADGAAHIREWMGLPTFALQLWLILTLARTMTTTASPSRRREAHSS